MQTHPSLLNSPACGVLNGAKTKTHNRKFALFILESLKGERSKYLLQTKLYLLCGHCNNFTEISKISQIILREGEV